MTSLGASHKCAQRALGTVRPQPMTARSLLSSHLYPRGVSRTVAVAGVTLWGRGTHSISSSAASPLSSCSTRAWQSGLQCPGRMPWRLLQAEDGRFQQGRSTVAAWRTMATQADASSEVSNFAASNMQVDEIMLEIRKAMGIKARPITDEVTFAVTTQRSLGRLLCCCHLLLLCIGASPSAAAASSWIGDATRHGDAPRDRCRMAGLSPAGRGFH